MSKHQKSEIKTWYPEKDFPKFPNLQKMFWKLNMPVEDACTMYTVPEMLRVSKIIGDYEIIQELEVNDPKTEEARIIYATSKKPAPLIYPRFFLFLHFFLVYLKNHHFFASFHHFPLKTDQNLKLFKNNAYISK